MCGDLGRDEIRVLVKFGTGHHLLTHVGHCHHMSLLSAHLLYCSIIRGFIVPPPSSLFIYYYYFFIIN